MAEARAGNKKKKVHLEHGRVVLRCVRRLTRKSVVSAMNMAPRCRGQHTGTCHVTHTRTPPPPTRARANLRTEAGTLSSFNDLRGDQVRHVAHAREAGQQRAVLHELRHTGLGRERLPCRLGPRTPARSAAVAGGAAQEAQEDGAGASEKPRLPPATGGLRGCHPQPRTSTH